MLLSLAGESKTAAIRQVLRERRQRLLLREVAERVAPEWWTSLRRVSGRSCLRVSAAAP